MTHPLPRRLLLGAAIASLLPLTAAAPAENASAAKHEQRCGWIVNPTPGNWWLNDRDGEWTIGEQGGYQAKGTDNIPDLTESRWVVTNGASYGYGCGCMTVDTDRKTRRIKRIYSVKQKALAVCRADRKLPRP
jgi:hypothetical protein